MKYFFSLRINANKDQVEKITDILGLKPNDPHVDWGYEIKDRNNEYVNFIEYFLNMLKGKYDKLARIGIERDQISIWMIYEYEQQCNMEFDPVDLKNLGDNGITLCISCYLEK